MAYLPVFLPVADKIQMASISRSCKELAENLLARKMTCHKMPRFQLNKLRAFFYAPFFCPETASVETAALGGIYRTGNISLKYYPLLFHTNLRIGDRDGREECLCVGMHRVPVQAFTCVQLHQFAKIHNTNAV